MFWFLFWGKKNEENEIIKVLINLFLEFGRERVVCF